VNTRFIDASSLVNFLLFTSHLLTHFDSSGSWILITIS
jgi:hypothetical protein